MCLIIHRNDTRVIDTNLIARGMEDNPDGWGIMTVENGRIVTIRDMNMDLFWGCLAAIGDAPVTIHFRYATHGAKNTDNCHPFDIMGGEYSLMHNGVIDIPIRDKGRSDTYHFANHILTPILSHDPGAFGTPYLSRLLSSIVGYGNKLVIMRADGEVMIVNEEQGAWHDGLWLSNRHSLPMAGRIGQSLISAASKYRLSAWRDEELDGWDIRERTYRDDSDDLIPIDDLDEGLVELETIKEDCPDALNEYELLYYAGMDYDQILDQVECDPDAVATAIWSHWNEIFVPNKTDDTKRYDAR